MRISVFMLIAVMALLGGCITNPVSDPGSPYFMPPPGSRFIVKREINIEANNSSAWFQGGKQQHFRQLDLYYPNCKFEMRNLVDVPRVVKPDVFIVTRVKQEEQLENIHRDPVRFAAASVGIGIGGGSRSGIGFGIGLGFNVGGTSPIPYATVFYLKSEQQPDVMRLTCMHWEDATDARHLTFAEVKKALGDYFDIEVAEPKSRAR